MADFTNMSFLTSSTWLVIGVLFYFYLSLRKVFLLKHVHLKLESGTVIERELWKYYEIGFWITLATNRKLLTSTFRYLFNHKRSEWPEAKYDRLKRRMNILDGFTAFLKPYLAFALIWVFLKAWIESLFWIDRLSMTLGEVQQLLFLMDQFAPFHFLIIYKNVILLILAIILICIPFFFSHEPVSKRYRRLATNFIVLLSLLGNISFFGAKAAEATAEKTSQLLPVKAEILAVHDRVYAQVMAQIVANSAEDFVHEEENTYRRTENFIDTVLARLHLDSLDATSLQSMRLRIDKLREEFAREYAMPAGDMPPDRSVATLSYTFDASRFNPREIINGKPVRQSRHFDAKLYEKASVAVSIAEEYKKQVSTGKPPVAKGNYIVNESAWTVKEGTELERGLQKAAEAETSVVKKKLVKIFEKVIEYVAGETVPEMLNIVSEWWGVLAGNKTISKAITIFIAESTAKKKAASMTVDLLNEIKTKATHAARSFRTIKMMFQIDAGNTREEVKGRQTTASKQVFREEIVATNLRKEEAKRANDPDVAGEPVHEPGTAINFWPENEWEALRRRMLQEIDQIDCPFIDEQRSQFRYALYNWTIHTTMLGMRLSTGDLEVEFWNYAQSKPVLVEAFARAIIWYKSSAIAFGSSGGVTVAEALIYYKDQNPSVKKEVERHIPRFGNARGCGKAG